MGNTLKKLGEAELEIMQVIWDSDSPVTSNYILKELQGRRKWQLSTLMTSFCILRLFRNPNIRPEQANIFSKSYIIIPYGI